MSIGSSVTTGKGRFSILVLVILKHPEEKNVGALQGVLKRENALRLDPTFPVRLSLPNTGLEIGLPSGGDLQFSVR